MSIANTARVYTWDSKAWTCKWQVLRRSCKGCTGERRDSGTRSVGRPRGGTAPPAAPQPLGRAQTVPSPGRPEGERQPPEPGGREPLPWAVAPESGRLRLQREREARGARRPRPSRQPGSGAPPRSSWRTASDPSLPPFLLSLLPSCRWLAAGKTCRQHEKH